MPCLVLVHGTAAEGWVGDAVYDALMAKVLGRTLDYTWKGLLRRALVLTAAVW